MTTRVSNNGEAAVQNKKYSPVFHNWRCNVKANRKMQIVLTILHMVAAPAILLSAIISMYSHNDMDGAMPYAVIGAITTSIAAFLGIFVAVENFKCLYSRSVVDMRLSLPLTADQRFFSNFLSGIFTYLAPFFAAQVFSLLLAGYGLLFMEGKTFYRYTYGSYPDYQKKLEPYECDYFSYIMPMLLKLILCGTLIMLMLYTLTVLVTVCCGSKFESIAYAILINGVIPLTILMVTLSMFDDIFGVDPSTNAIKIFLLTSPAGGVFTAFEWAIDDDFPSYMNPAVWAIVFFLITAAIGALAFFLYRKRRAEQVSKPFVFKLLYYIILTGGIFCLYSIFFIADISIIPTIITTAIVYMIFEVVTNRGFKKFWLSGIKYAATMISAFLLIFIAQKTDGFGALWRVPSANMVAAVEINYDGFYCDFSKVTSYNTVVLSDKENIKAVIAAHESILDEYKKYRNDTGSSYYDHKGVNVNCSMVVTYKLTSGGTIERWYDSYVTPETIELLSSIDLTNEYKTQVAEKYRASILDAKTQFELSMEYQKSQNRSDYLGNTVKLNNKLRSRNYYDNSSGGISMYYLYTHNFFEQLADAYAKDIMAINDENYYHSEIPEQYSLTIPSGGTINIPGSFENTLQLLADFDFYIQKNEDISDAEIYLKTIMTYAMMFSSDEWRDITEIDDRYVLHPNYSGSMYIRPTKNIMECSYYIYDLDEELFDIIRYSQPRNIIGENGYIINVSDTSYVVPAEMQSAAERIAAGRTPYSQSQEELNGKYLDQLRRNADGASTYYYDIAPDTIMWD